MVTISVINEFSKVFWSLFALGDLYTTPTKSLSLLWSGKEHHTDVSNEVDGVTSDDLKLSFSDVNPCPCPCP